MRFPIPERFKPRSTLIFIVAVVLGQQLEKTDPIFSLLTALYIGMFAVGFNIGGGLSYLAGAFIFFNGVSSAIIGIVFKLFLNEPGQSNLLVPLHTMEAYCLGMAGMVGAAVVSRSLIAKKGLLSDMAAGPAMKQAAMGCLILGIILQLGSVGGLRNSASFSSAIGQINHFIQMAIILGTTYEIQSSGGKRSSNWVVWVAGLWLFFFGLIVFSKEGMFISIASWLIPAVALSYDFSRKQILGGIMVGFLIIHYLVPFSQYGRTFRGESATGNTISAFGLLRHPELTRQLYLEQEETQDDRGAPHFFDAPQGIFDRETMLAYDDAIISYTDQGNLRGFGPTISSLVNVVPRFIWKDKPAVLSGNEYGREIGVISEEDETTGISFSLIGDAYHQDAWIGVILIVPFVTFLLFFVGDSLCGDTRKSPWGLLLIALASHAAAEGLVAAVVYLATFGAFAVTIIAVMSKYFLPIFTNLLLGTERTRVRRTPDFRPMVRGSRINPLLRQPDPETPPS